jgi:hypothetical protein
MSNEPAVTQCVTTATKSGDKWLHRCTICGRTQLFKNADPSRVHMKCGKPHAPRPGTELRRMFRVLGVTPAKNCKCKAFAREMDAMGVDGCRAAREEIAAKLQAKSAEFGLDTFLSAGLRALTSGIALRINPLHPFLSLVDLAIERASHDPRQHGPQPNPPPA